MTSTSMLQNNLRKLGGSAEKLVYMYLYFKTQLEMEDEEFLKSFSINEISKELDMHRSNVYRRINKLAERGVIEKTDLEKNIEVKI